MAYFMSPVVIEIPGMDALLADTIGVAILILIVVTILKVIFGDPPERRGASEMRPHVGGYQPRDTPPTMQRPASDDRRPQRPPPKPINRHCNGGCARGMCNPPAPPKRRCPSKGFGEPISCSECDCPPGKK